MFYITSPKGEIPLYILKDCILTRLDYLRSLDEGCTNKFDGNFDYLLENSTYDKIGHFILRLLASISSDLYIYWITKESLLFKHRLDYILPKQLYRLFKQIIKEIQISHKKKSTIQITLIELCKFYLQPLVFKHLISNCCNCNKFHYKVKFDVIPDLVRERTLKLNNGHIITYCSNWKKVLQSLFNNYITCELINMQKQAQYTVKHDLRLQILNHKIQSYLFKKNIENGSVNIDNIDTEVEKFPLCMQHLHSVLKSRHRLSHYARLYYSLFLKEAGMNIEDAITFWKQEYSKPHTCTSICSHNWQSNEKKFVYSIRHIYGLEGSRKIYKTPDCKRICASISGSAYEGGCPFKHFDVIKLRSLLHSSLTEDEIEKLLNNISVKSPESLCTTYLKCVHKSININTNIIKSPVEFYQLVLD